MTRERRLGRGLEALLGNLPQPADAGESTAGAPPQTHVADAVAPIAAQPPEPGSSSAEHEPTTNDGSAPLPLTAIQRNPFQPRQEFDENEIASLAESLREHGLLQPIAVRRTDSGYELIAGERRLRAAERIGWSDVPARIVEADDRQMAELALVENLQRKDLNPLEKAASFKRYLETYRCKQDELAKRVQIDRSTVANLIRLLELPAAVQDELRAGRLTQGHARALLPLGDERQQVEMATRIQAEGLSVRQTEAIVQDFVAEDDEGLDGPRLAVVDGESNGRTKPSDQIAALEQEIRVAVGMKVKLSANDRGRGKLTIHFRDSDEFETLRDILCDPGRGVKAARYG